MTTIEFTFKNQKVTLSDTNYRSLYRKIVDYLYDNGYSFEGDFHTTVWKKIYNESEKNEKINSVDSFDENSFYNIRKSGKYILQNSTDCINFGKKMLELMGCEFKSEYSAMEKEKIEKNIKLLCEASIKINNCINDNQFLCDVLNKIDKNFIGQYYRSDKEGVVIEIRKDVAKNILLNDITVDKLISIINQHKNNNPKKLKSWNNPYKIINPFINNSFLELDNFIIEFSNQIKNRIGNVKSHIVNFNGSQYQGTDQYWIAFYNEKHKSQSDGLQLFFQFYLGKFTYGIYQHSNEEYLVGPIEYTSVDDIYTFIDEHKNIILDEEIKPKMTFIQAAKHVLEQNENRPMTSGEIWNEISKNRLVSSVGKTPQLSLNSIITSHSINLEEVAPDRQPKKRFEVKNSIFKIVSKDPYKFVLINYMPSHIKENLIRNGFITIDMLANIFEKNGLKFEI